MNTQQNNNISNKSIINNISNKHAVLVGINYNGTNSQLNGCINDVDNLHSFLLDKCNYHESNINILTDDTPDLLPTKQNIMNSLENMINKAKTENCKELWFSYSGHGSHINDTNGDEKDGQDEVICPLDYNTAGFITDDYFLNLIKQLPTDVKLIVVMDCCHSGTMFDLPYLYKNDVISDNNINGNTLPNVIMISGCKDTQTSADAYIDNNYSGAMTWSYLKTLKDNNYNITTKALVDNMRKLLKNNNYTQIPVLSVSKKNDIYDNYYSNNEIIQEPIPEPEIINIPKDQNIYIEVKVDRYFSESIWNIWDIQNEKYVFNTNVTFTKPYENARYTITLPHGKYYFIMYDTYGDGGMSAKFYNGLYKNENKLIFKAILVNQVKQVLFEV
jgi:hypothetical protein